MVVRRFVHDKSLEAIAEKLSRKPYVALLQTKKEYFLPGKNSPHGELDIITFSPRRLDGRRTRTYWEIKTGSHKNCYKKAVDQAKHFYEWARTIRPEHFVSRFVYINVRENIVIHVREHDVL